MAMKGMTGFAAGMLVVGCLGTAGAAEKAPSAIVDHVSSVVAAWGADEVCVAAARAQNAKRQSLDQIKALDKKWMATAGVDDFMQSLIDNPCGREARRLQAQSKFYAEIFVTDAKGANVCMTDKTSDYWQGDEAKFIRSYAKGAGSLFVDDVSFDESTQTYLVQASVPVMDGGRAIGVVTVGIDVDAFEAQ